MASYDNNSPIVHSLKKQTNICRLLKISFFKKILNNNNENDKINFID